MFSSVEPENVLALPRSWVDSAEVFAALHLPDGGYHTILLYSMVGDFFRARSCGLTLTSLFSQVLFRHRFLLRHLNSTTPLRLLFFVVIIEGIVAHEYSGVYWPARRSRLENEPLTLP